MGKLLTTATYQLYKVREGELSLPGQVGLVAEAPHESVGPGFDTSWWQIFPPSPVLFES